MSTHRTFAIGDRVRLFGGVLWASKFDIRGVQLLMPTGPEFITPFDVNSHTGMIVAPISTELENGRGEFEVFEGLKAAIFCQYCYRASRHRTSCQLAEGCWPNDKDIGPGPFWKVLFSTGGESPILVFCGQGLLRKL